MSNRIEKYLDREDNKPKKWPELKSMAQLFRASHARAAEQDLSDVEREWTEDMKAMYEAGVRDEKLRVRRGNNQTYPIVILIVGLTIGAILGMGLM